MKINGVQKKCSRLKAFNIKVFRVKGAPNEGTKLKVVTSGQIDLFKSKGMCWAIPGIFSVIEVVKIEGDKWSSCQMKEFVKLEVAKIVLVTSG